MSAKTSIEWTDRTWNPTRGCSMASGSEKGGCLNCYAARMASRGFAWAKGLARMTENGPRWTGVVRLIPEALDEPLRWRKPQRVFVNSMSDLFHESLPDEAIDGVFAVMALAAHHTFQILTKRPERMRAYLSDLDGAAGRWSTAATMIAIPRWLTVAEWLPEAYHGDADETVWRRVDSETDSGSRPLRNVWVGTSVEDQATADERIPLLLQTPAACRFVSYEPALSGVDFKAFQPFSRKPIEPSVRAHLRSVYPNGLPADSLNAVYERMKVDWLIVGGESGPGARPFDLAWARSAVAQCKAAGVPVFIKQVGARPIERCPECYGSGASIPANTSGTCPECRGDGIFTLRLRDRKGGSMEEWPEDLRVREFPKGATA